MNSVTHGRAYTAPARMASFLLAIAMAGVILTYPKALEHASHGSLMLVMLGVSAGFVHGVGFIPEHKLWRILLGPWTAWVLLVAGFLMFLLG